MKDERREDLNIEVCGRPVGGGDQGKQQQLPTLMVHGIGDSTKTRDYPC